MQREEHALYELVAANHILANEEVLDAFGHVSARHPARPDRYLISRSRSPEIVEAQDVLEMTLDSEPVNPDAPKSYAERVIHGAIYQERPDVQAICHCHATALLPFCITDVPIVPVFHLGATVGASVPVWRSRDSFGDTNLLVSTKEESRSLASTLRDNWAVLMQNHGAVVVGRTVREMVFRAIQLCRNAELLLQALKIGVPHPLSAKEIQLAGDFNLGEPVQNRAWEYWLRRANRNLSQD